MPSSIELKVTPLHETFGCQVDGFDFSSPIDDRLFKEITDIIGQYGVVVFPKTTLDDEQQLEFSRRFGELDSPAHHYKPGVKKRLPHPDIWDISNLTADDEIIVNDESRIASAKGNATFHADGSFNLGKRTFLSMLRAVRLPPVDTSTEFADARQAYDDLPDEMKEFLEDKVACHSLFQNRKMANPDSPLYKDVNVLDHPLSKHKVVITHEASGRKTLYVPSYAHHIEGMPVEEGKTLIAQLFAHATQPKYVYAKHWHNIGELTIWDNTAVLHRAVRGEYLSQYKRDMRRTSTLDMGPEAFGMNIPGQTQKVATL